MYQLPLQLLWKQLGNSVKDEMLLLEYIYSQLSDATELSYEGPAIQNSNSDDDKTGQSESPPGSKVYVAMTTTESINTIQELFSEHAQYVMPIVVATTTAEDRCEESALLNVQLCIWRNYCSVALRRAYLYQLGVALYHSRVIC